MRWVRLLKLMLIAIWIATSIAISILSPISARAQSTAFLRPAPGLLDQVYLWKHKQDCNLKFKAPLLNNDGAPCSPANSTTATFDAVANSAYETYESLFFEGVRQEQVQQHACQKEYLNRFDQNRLRKGRFVCPRNLEGSLLAGASQQAIEDVLRNARATEDPLDKDAQENQKLVLEHLYDNFKNIDQALADVDYLRSADLALAYASGDGGMQPTKSQFDAISKRQGLEKQVQEKLKTLGEYRMSLWSGSDPLVWNYVLENRKSKLSKEQFVKQALDRNRRDSFQQKVVTPLKFRAVCGETILKEAHPPFSQNTKVDLVKSGAAGLKIARTGDRAKEYEGLACYLDAVYGNGRSDTYSAISKVGMAATAATLLFGGPAGWVGAAALIAVGSEIVESGHCYGGFGVTSIVSSNVCEDLKKVKSNSEFLNIASQDMKLRMSCFSQLASAAVENGNPFVKQAGMFALFGRKGAKGVMKYKGMGHGVDVGDKIVIRKAAGEEVEVTIKSIDGQGNILAENTHYTVTVNPDGKVIDANSKIFTANGTPAMPYRPELRKEYETWLPKSQHDQIFSPLKTPDDAKAFPFRDFYGDAGVMEVRKKTPTGYEAVPGPIKFNQSDNVFERVQANKNTPLGQGEEVWLNQFFRPGSATGPKWERSLNTFTLNGQRLKLDNVRVLLKDGSVHPLMYNNGGFPAIRLQGKTYAFNPDELGNAIKYSDGLVLQLDRIIYSYPLTH